MIQAMVMQSVDMSADGARPVLSVAALHERTASQRAGDLELVHLGPVGVGGVDQRDAEVQCPLDHGPARAVVALGRAVRP